MNLKKASGMLHAITFRLSRLAKVIFPAGKIFTFGTGKDKVGSILVINLDRRPKRWRCVLKELNCFRTSEGALLGSITHRLSAIDARDGRAIAATADIDTLYRIGDHLFVQPNPMLEDCFDVDEQIRMTRQEIAVARSHVEAWKTIATGSNDYVLVLEDDVWFKKGAAKVIDRCWMAALRRYHNDGRPHLLYLSYKDAVGIDGHADVSETLFRPIRGFWFLSGYILSREGAAILLRAMPVVGPVDLWINHRFAELDVLALSSPVIMQREDCGSDNSYSILPYLARAGIVDAEAGPMQPNSKPSGLVIAWTSGNEHEGLTMALSMLGLRVRAFDGSERHISKAGLANLGTMYDAIVDIPLTLSALSSAIEQTDVKFVLEKDAAARFGIDPAKLPSSRVLRLWVDHSDDIMTWAPLCTFLNLAPPIQEFPVGAPRNWRLFRDDRPDNMQHPSACKKGRSLPLDDSPWVLPPRAQWWPRKITTHHIPTREKNIVDTGINLTTPFFAELTETFPGNLASFAKDGILHDKDGTSIVISNNLTGIKPYRSGALSSVWSFCHGRFEAEIKAAPGFGLITGFFLHRDLPRQEIDIELPGDNPQQMLVNVYFNPGDDGSTMGFGYRGSPYCINLGFDSTSDFHLYSIDWRPGLITWSVDGKIVHERVGWDPTPLPHLPMRLLTNLWAPRSEELAGLVNKKTLPATATFKNVSIWK